jgi:acyl-CoA thioesterase I
MSKRNFYILVTGILLLAGTIWWKHSHYPIRNAKPSGANINAFGDSLTEGFGAAQGEDYPSRLSEMTGIPILNRGRNSETSAQALQRLDRDVLKEDPKIVIVLLGGNDLLQKTPLDTTFENLDKIVERIQDQGALVILVGLRNVFGDKYGPRFKELARRRGAVLVPDVLRDIISSPKLKSDQVHPNGAGYKIVAERIHAALKPYL